MAEEMSMPPELTDTYPNIPPEEQAAAKASQLPDEEMESAHEEFILNEALSEQDQIYLAEVLEQDDRLSTIFDSVMDVATEFSGSGAVEGLGTGVSDSIPARLSDGEFVFTKKAVDQIGAENLQTIMDEAERAYDEANGKVAKAMGGIIATEEEDVHDELKTNMVEANQMPSKIR